MMHAVGIFLLQLVFFANNCVCCAKYSYAWLQLKCYSICQFDMTQLSKLCNFMSKYSHALLVFLLITKPAVSYTVQYYTRTS